MLKFPENNEMKTLDKSAQSSILDYKVVEHGNSKDMDKTGMYR